MQRRRGARTGKTEDKTQIEMEDKEVCCKRRRRRSRAELSYEQSYRICRAEESHVGGEPAGDRRRGVRAPVIVMPHGLDARRRADAHIMEGQAQVQAAGEGDDGSAWAMPRSRRVKPPRRADQNR